MDKRNTTIAALAVVVLIMAFFLFQKDANAPQPATQNDGQQQAAVPPPPPPPAVNPPPPPPPGPGDIELADPDKLVDNNWLLQSAVSNGVAVDMDVNVPQALTLNFAKAKNGFSGFSGCNTFGGTYSTGANNSFDFGAVVATKKACPATMSLESGVLGAMDKIQTFHFEGTKLKMHSNDNKNILIYIPAI